MKGSSNVFIFLLTTILLAAVGGGVYYFFLRPKPTPPSNGGTTPPTTECETPGTKEGWCLFESEEYGFSIEYPVNWGLVIEGEAENEPGYFFVGPDQDLTDEEIADKKAIGYSPIALYRPSFVVLPKGGYGHGNSSNKMLESKKDIVLNKEAYNILRYKGGFTCVCAEYDPGGKFRIEFFPGKKDVSAVKIFDKMFETLKFNE